MQVHVVCAEKNIIVASADSILCGKNSYSSLYAVGLVPLFASTCLLCLRFGCSLFFLPLSFPTSLVLLSSRSPSLPTASKLYREIREDIALHMAGLAGCLN